MLNVNNSAARIESDFWWLTPEQMLTYIYLEVWHQDPYSDESCSKRQPYSVRCFSSLDASGNLSSIVKRYPLTFTREWRDKSSNINIFRSLCLFSAKQDGDELLGPLVLDIDRAERRPDRSYVQHLDEALEACRTLIKRYLCGLNQADMRVFFSGHKGFNIEVRPEALSMASAGSRPGEFDCRLKKIRGFFGGSFVDVRHKHLRLHNSINRFIADSGKTVDRMKFELSLDEVNSLSADKICHRSEVLAAEYLSAKER